MKLKYLSGGIARHEFYGPGTREAALLVFGDDQNTWIVINQQVGGDEFVPETGEYSDVVGETLILEGPPSIYGEIPTGPTSTYALTCPELGIQWCECTVEELTKDGDLVLLAVEGARSDSVDFEGSRYEYVVEFRLAAERGGWLTKPSGHRPGGFTLVPSRA